MPTTRPRHYITESDELAAALDAAALRWPGLSRAQLLVRLAVSAGTAEQKTAKQRWQERQDVIRQHAGALTGSYGPDYLAELRAEWPE